jgi:branched-chain amino acid transport system substrate-binding protein
LLIADAIKKNGATPEQIRNGIEQSSNLVGISGVFNMSATDHNGLDLTAFEMVKIVKGDWALAQ